MDLGNVLSWKMEEPKDNVYYTEFLNCVNRDGNATEPAYPLREEIEAYSLAQAVDIIASNFPTSGLSNVMMLTKWALVYGQDLVTSDVYNIMIIAESEEVLSLAHTFIRTFVANTPYSQLDNTMYEFSRRLTELTSLSWQKPNEALEGGNIFVTSMEYIFNWDSSVEIKKEPIEKTSGYKSMEEALVNFSYSYFGEEHDQTDYYAANWGAIIGYDMMRSDRWVVLLAAGSETLIDRMVEIWDGIMENRETPDPLSDFATIMKDITE